VENLREAGPTHGVGPRLGRIDTLKCRQGRSGSFAPPGSALVKRKRGGRLPNDRAGEPRRGRRSREHRLSGLCTTAQEVRTLGWSKALRSRAQACRRTLRDDQLLRRCPGSWELCVDSSLARVGLSPARRCDMSRRFTRLMLGSPEERPDNPTCCRLRQGGWHGWGE
jgi:hypothetical protein